ncbi:MAG TPA: 16S rRNA (cytosine(1402)-N(4))-methyltransferase RsmH [Bdellovibrionota bacterium]|nr:16S rRNA (cytosine(1402)-N(4))-methyltransferase RsmH [Bdellovibrionota bacterium]
MPGATTVHQSVLLHETIDPLLEALKASGGGTPAWIVDCTLGGGGHTAALLEAGARVISFDQDAGAFQAASKRFEAEIREGRLEIVHAPFASAAERLQGRRVIGILADLGFSSDQLEDAARGLSFLNDGPLDMRMDRSRGETARELLSRLPETEIADLIYELGEERFSRRIARRIVEERGRGGIPDSTATLARWVISALPGSARHGRIHGATRTFQALRIAVNDELGQLDALLDHVILSLAPGGRMSVISFHSLEDRKVKVAFKRLGQGGGFRILTKKPIEAQDDEVKRNSRARSAKLRVIERVE